MLQNNMLRPPRAVWSSTALPVAHTQRRKTSRRKCELPSASGLDTSNSERPSSSDQSARTQVHMMFSGDHHTAGSMQNVADVSESHIDYEICACLILSRDATLDRTYSQLQAS